MSAKNPLDGIVKFCETERTALLAARLVAHTQAACEAAGVPAAELANRLGRDVFAVVATCVIEDMMTLPAGPDGPNATDAYMKRHGWKLTAVARRQLQAVRESVMGLYEIESLEPDVGLRARSLLLEMEPVFIEHPGLSRALPVGCVLGARVVQVDGVTGVTGGLLPIEAKFALEAVTAVRQAAGVGDRELAASDMPGLAPHITNFWLLKTLQEAAA